ncbi:HAMP domain-containing sensor histidine kinase [Thermomonas sp.]|uniref:sensor histidine kinase n=1 Tax=Thermomonas sp. TaxID=1971895 RepID=UPI002CC8B2AF|nr:HAMP domain-containing sensor histidine kinase [Thermomonas sp.]HRO64070.1 HAMP domain-containing sensor histidine kinase [Thermomonas sp.]
MKRLLPSTSARLALVVMGSFLIAFVLIGGGVYFAVSTLLLDDARGAVHADASDLMGLHQAEGLAALRAELEARINEGSDDPNAVYALADGAGNPLIGRLPDAGRPEGNRGRWVEFNEQASDDGGSLRVIAVERALPGGGILLVGQALAAQDRLLGLMQQAALLALLVAMVAGALVGWLTSRWVARRLRNLDATVGRVANGELGLRATLDHSGDAFDQVAGRFNRMLDRIEDLLGGVRHATDHIAHDLRTPLTRLHNRLEGLHHEATGDSARLGLARALADTDQILQSFGALLRLARIEAQAPDAQAPDLALLPLAEDAVEMYAPIAAVRGIRIDSRLHEADVRGDRDQLFQMLVNLLDNALKYAPADSVVTVTLGIEEGAARLEIADRGPGIPETERERVFDRFQRLEAHRGTPGVGLGLSLVRAIVHHHGGRVALLDNLPGLRVRVMLPLP